MKIGRNLFDIRNSKGYSKEYVANALNIKIEEYEKIENDLVEITLNQLEEISRVFSCSPVYIIQYRESSGSIYNFFDNEGSSGTNIHVQGIDQEEIRKAYKELYSEELKRIPKFEKLLHENNIEFNF